MKYAKEFQQKMVNLPLYLQEACLDYRLWKKRCKQLRPEEALVLLKEECHQVDSMFCGSYKDYSSHSQPLLVRCFCKNPVRVAPETLLLYANMNSKTVYKICKRLSKQTLDSTPMNWLTAVRAAHVFGFMGGHHTSYLALRQSTTQAPLLECPLCVNDVEPKHMLVYMCGHYACISCTLQYAKVQLQRGEWYHLLSGARRRACPYCRFERAFHEVTTV